MLTKLDLNYAQHARTQLSEPSWSALCQNQRPIHAVEGNLTNPIRTWNRSIDLVPAFALACLPQLPPPNLASRQMRAPFDCFIFFNHRVPFQSMEFRMWRTSASKWVSNSMNE
mmetsp:Transcript_22580/g.37733  ORF Transcript_22580/g.37733 Transcript_22580/m.37733 type:complete len:113 (+) Transcript_22580:367-705(+)